MTESTQAVFLSYTSQDAEVARRICDSLRAAGIEVWFDQSELRGGDAWDAAIKRQIKACALFMPIISRNSHSRVEGYFRLEWKLAVDRSHLIASDRPFLLPVTVDETEEAEARVPDRFRDVQWTRLPGGTSSSEFIAHVKRLLASIEAQAGSAPARGERAPAPAPLATPPSPAPTAQASRRRLALIAVAALLVIGLGAWAALRYLGHAQVIEPYSLADRRMTFAVLPFEAPSGDAAAARVASAVAEAVMAAQEANNLWAQVAPRRSVEQAIHAHAASKDIGAALDVRFLIRGTVSRVPAGYAVDLFLMEAESERVLRKRSLEVPTGAELPPWGDDVIDRVQSLTFGAVRQEVALAKTKPDAAFDVRDLSFRAIVQWSDKGKSDAKGAYEAATALLNRALTLAPDDRLATFLTAEVNLCDCVNGWSKDVETQIAIGSNAMEKYLARDPSSPEMLSDKADLFIMRGRFEDALAIAESILSRNPQSEFGLPMKSTALLKLGRPAEALATVKTLAEHAAADWPEGVAGVANIHYALGEYDIAARMARDAASRMSHESLANPVNGPVLLTLAAAEAHLNHPDRARAALTDLQALVPRLTSIGAVRKWIRPNADLAGYEPLYAGLKLAGLPD